MSILDHRCPRCKRVIGLRDNLNECQSCGAVFPQTIREALSEWANEPTGTEGPLRNNVSPLPAESSRTAAGAHSRTAAPLKEPTSDDAAWLVQRYADAYRIGANLGRLGDAVKVIGVILGLFLILPSLGMILSASRFNDGTVVFMALVASVPSVLTVMGGFILGVLIASHGQILLATLDAAVNTSVALGSDDRARVLRTFPRGRSHW